MHSMWVRLGRVPSLFAVLACYAALVVAALLLDSTAYIIVGLGALGVLIAYCVARPHSGLDVFAYAWLPGPIGGILDALGVPGGWGLLVLLFVLPALYRIDRDPVRRSDAAEVLAAPRAS